MESHTSDPTTNGQPDPWDTVTEEFGGLSQRLKDTYRRIADDHGPSEEDIKDAFSTLAGAWDQVAQSVTTAMQDPVVREHMKDAASSLATALGTTISELGVELRKSSEEE